MLESPQDVCFLPSGSIDNHAGWGRTYAFVGGKKCPLFLILR